MNALYIAIAYFAVGGVLCGMAYTIDNRIIPYKEMLIFSVMWPLIVCAWIGSLVAKLLNKVTT